MESIPTLVSDALVIFADLQEDIVPRQQTMKAKRLRKFAAALAKIAKICELPIVVTVAARGDAAPKLIPELADVVGDAKLFPRTSGDVMTDPAARAAIEETGRKTIIICGVATEIVVALSSLSAAATGYRVLVVMDATGGLDERSETATLMRLTQAGVVPTALATVGAELAGDFRSERGQGVMGVLFAAIAD